MTGTLYEDRYTYFSSYLAQFSEREIFRTKGAEDIKHTFYIQ
jgi:hypothetical protein